MTHGLTLIQRIKVVARRFGVELTRFDPSSTIDARRMRILSAHGVTLALDVGANTGQYARRLRMSGFRGRIVSFEPVSDAFAQLKRHATTDENWECLQMALGRSDDVAEIEVGESSVTSSFLALEPHLSSNPDWRRVRAEKVRIARLDSLAPSLIAREDTPFLKMDVQGYELHVLQGASQTLGQVDVVEAEMTLTAHYVDQASYLEIIEFLHEAGFGLASVEPGYVDPSSGYVSWIDGIFVRRADRAAATE